MKGINNTNQGKKEEYIKKYKENLKINFKKGRVWTMLIIIVLSNLSLSYLLINLHKSIGFIVSAIIAVTFLSIAFIILTNLRRKVMLILALLVILNIETHTSANYCIDPNEPFWTYPLTDSPELNGVPVSLRILFFNLKLNPCNIPTEYFTTHEIIKDRW